VFGGFGGFLGLGSFGGAFLGIVFGFAHSVAFSLDTDDIGVVHDAVDERCRAGGVGEYGVPVGEEEVGRQYEAFLLVAPADNLE